MLSRIAVARRIPRAFAAPVRMFNGRTEGSVAQSKGFKYVVVCFHVFTRGF